ncbi:hypothetical protein [Hymenobacter defluvii]|uniref:Uncharacterized protein n=1 Tax=Hymenobacter defluvii TaxID=2054411 RepID=A0ABS3TDZ4_9BACT|nr:hypothetical protein [Hymenobacter defluvii]MBO3271847.1 hypothetical protein [Hymenobacter defluvii]
MTSEIHSIVAEIDKEIRQHPWFDFHVFSYNGSELVIAGSEDLSCYHTLEIVFEDVFFMSGFYQGWHSDTKAPVFILPQNESDLNQQFEIEQGYIAFIFKAEDYKNDIVVAAKHISYNTDTIFYYEREGLKEKERLASFVKKKSVASTIKPI